MDTRAKVRRKADPLWTQKIWDAIMHYNGLKHAPRIKELNKFCRRQYSMSEEEVESHLQNMMDDGLVSKKYASNGTPKSVDQLTYHIPKDLELTKSSHDWYCFQCHKPGPVLDCSTCHLVYHPDCLENVKILEHFICPYCQEMKRCNLSKTPRRTLNQMLQFICDKLNSTMPADIRVWSPEASTPVSAALTTDRCASIQNKKQRQGSKTASVDPWRFKLLIHPRNRLDLDTMDSRTDRLVYRKVQRFRLEAATIVHAVVIFHGEHSAMADAARQMHRECLHELEEMSHCRDCFLRSHEQDDPDWFCYPCRPPHRLAFAKQKGYPYWPAKVIRIKNTTYDVRFFGANHERALVDQLCIRPITASASELGVKRTPSWNRAFDELQKHQRMLDSYTPDDFSSEDSDVDSVFSDEETTNSMKKVPNKLITKELRVNLEKLDLAKLKKLSPASSSPPHKKLKREDFVELTVNFPVPSCDSSFDNLKPSLSETKIEEVMSASEKLKLEEEIISLKKQLAQKDEEMRQLEEKYNLQFSYVKKKQWCATCEKEASMSCCWNTSYCSAKCQVIHWNVDHKRRCRRGRKAKNL